MSQIVHITFEKITGLKGTFEGDFICNDTLDPEVPLVFNAFLLHNMEFVFTQNGRYVYMRLVNWRESVNYIEHFISGVNFLIKSWSYGNGVGTGSKNPN